MAWMKMDYPKHMHFLWKIKWRLGALGIMGEMALFKQLRYGFLKSNLLHT